jgi:hypothetical protein
VFHITITLTAIPHPHPHGGTPAIGLPYTIQNEFNSSTIVTRREEYENVQFTRTVGAILN